MDVQDERLSVFRRRDRFDLPLAVSDRSWVRFLDGDLVILRGQDELVRGPVHDVHFWQPPKWLTNCVSVLFAGDERPWRLMTTQNGLFALRHAQAWADAFALELTERGAHRGKPA